MLIRHPEADARMARSRGLVDYWPQLLSYPLTGYCLPVVVMLSLLITLAMSSSVTGLPLLGIAVIWVVFYLMRVIDHTTRGYATPPPMGGDALYLASAMRPLTLPVMVGLSYVAAQRVHPVAAQGLLAVALFVMPAYLFVLATEGQLASALNPLRWLQLILTMGLAYLLPCLLLAAGSLLLGRISGHVGTALVVGFCCYVLFGTAHVLGYLGFKRQHELGLQVDVPDPDATEREDAHKAQLQELVGKIHDWQLSRQEASAVAAIESHGGGPQDSTQFFEELFHALSIQGSPSLLHAAGRRLITLLLAARKSARALDIAEGCLNAHWHFAPANPAQLEALLRQAVALRFEELYERLLKGANADLHKDEPAWAGVQFQRAHHQSEGRHDDAGALALLQPLRAMTQHPQHAAFERMARTLESLLARR